MMVPHAKGALFCFATTGFIFATRKTNLDTPSSEYDDIHVHVLL